MSIENDESAPEVAEPAMSVVEDSVAAELSSDPTDFDEPAALDERSNSDTQVYTDTHADTDTSVRVNEEVQSRDLTYIPGKGLLIEGHADVSDTAEQSLVEAVPSPVEIQDDDAMSSGFEPGAILEPAEHDVLNGRGASVNGHKGNQRFRALCFQRKPEFEAGNHAAKRRVATEIVAATTSLHGRFLKRKSDKGPWFALTTERAILKACQVMRDFQRPDRVQLRELQAQNGARKRQRTTESTPGFSQLLQLEQLPPINENPDGVHEHDILSGRGAFVNGHSGNERFRTLAIERKPQFDSGNYSEKRALATEIVGMIRSLKPPGRFLKKINGASKGTDENWDHSQSLEGQWEELSDEKAIHKACQVMRDIARPDRIDGRRSKKKKLNAEDIGNSIPTNDLGAGKLLEGGEVDATVKDSMSILAETTAEATAVQEAVAATTEEILDKALDGRYTIKEEEEMTAATDVVAAAESEIEV